MSARHLSEEVAPEVLAGLGALSRVSRALVGTGELATLAQGALEEMTAALNLQTAALYLPDADGLQVSAGITTARLRQQLRYAEMERERRTLAAEVHDGLAQYLAVALRELALLDSGFEHSPERLRESITEAHRLVRARLQELVAP